MPPGTPIQTAQVLTERYGPSYRWLVTITGMVGVVSIFAAMVLPFVVVGVERRLRSEGVN